MTDRGQAKGGGIPALEAETSGGARAPSPGRPGGWREGIGRLLSLAMGPRSVWLVAFGAVLLALVITWRYPVYFHWDDVHYLKWARSHPNPLDAFRPSQGSLFATFRPLNILTWWVLYHLFGFHAAAYQLFVALLYAADFILFFSLVRRFYGVRAAWFALLGYGAVFYHLMYVVFWFSDLTFVLELFWIKAALLLLTLADRPGRSYIWGVPAFLCAGLTKEPSLLIVIPCLLLYVWAGRRDLPHFARRRYRLLLPALTVAGLLWLLLSPGVHNRQGIRQTAGLLDAIEFLKARWEFYAGLLMHRTGLLLSAAAFFLCGAALWPRQRSGSGSVRAILLLAVAVGLSILLWKLPAIALALVLLSGIPVLWRRPDWSIAWAWGFLPLLGILAIQMHVRTYLAEASFGFAIVLGIAAEEAIQSLAPLRRHRGARLLPFLASAFVLAGIVLISGQAREKLGALRILSDNRQNFREVSDFLLALPPGAADPLAVVSYPDMNYSYRGGVQRMSDEEKGGLQKTIEPHDLALWLPMRGRPDIHLIQSIKDYVASGLDSCYVWAMNKHEKKFLRDRFLPMRPVFEVARRGEEAGVYLIHRSAPSDSIANGRPVSPVSSGPASGDRH